MREAAEALATSASRDTWSLADAVLEYLPAQPVGRPVAGGVLTTHGGEIGVTSPLLRDQLEELADRLATDGVTNSRGDPWAPSGLDALRQTAMAWPPQDRLPACFRVHEESRSREGQILLRKLVDHAEGKPATIPEELARGINARKKRGARYLVTVEDMRHFRRHPYTFAKPAAAVKNPKSAKRAAAVKNPELVKGVPTEATKDDELVEDVQVGERSPQDPNVQHIQTVLAEAQAQRTGELVGEEAVDRHQGKLLMEAQNAVRVVIDDFKERRPSPVGYAQSGLNGLIRLVAQAKYLASEDPDEALRQLTYGDPDEALRRLTHDQP